jgi:hypothetical protein
VGFGERARPVGMQLIGNYFSEARLLNVAHRFQAATGWHAMRPASSAPAQGAAAGKAAQGVAQGVAQDPAQDAAPAPRAGGAS